MEKANTALEPIQMQICKTQEEMKSINDNQTYTQYYVMAPTFENDTIAKLQKIYGEPELEWLKLVAGHLVDSEDKLANQNEWIKERVQTGPRPQVHCRNGRMVERDLW